MKVKKRVVCNGKQRLFQREKRQLRVYMIVDVMLILFVVIGLSVCEQENDKANVLLYSTLAGMTAIFLIPLMMYNIHYRTNYKDNSRDNKSSKTLTKPIEETDGTLFKEKYTNIHSEPLCKYAIYQNVKQKRRVGKLVSELEKPYVVNGFINRKYSPRNNKRIERKPKQNIQSQR